MKITKLITSILISTLIFLNVSIHLGNKRFIQLGNEAYAATMYSYNQYSVGKYKEADWFWWSYGTYTYNPNVLYSSYKFDASSGTL